MWKGFLYLAAIVFDHLASKREASLQTEHEGTEWFDDEMVSTSGTATGLALYCTAFSVTIIKTPSENFFFPKNVFILPVRLQRLVLSTVY